ncbi:ABC transporter substrate-binding protein [Ruania alba]|uniref:Carbohydrate ABC transporter substrate-binding protein, CUT1 family n=1 Tax=Ruania alba TaxID=648782 RepID=A0A1H5EZH6_9MICO|nr:extracellular solute-binding protein [Ruania alba]SED96522.1 carbohydrate ABC transporter substrate-binding protein, CUT1 family [Ruania alba]
MRTTRRMAGGLAAVVAAGLALAACSGTPEGPDNAGGGEDVPEGATEVTFWQTQFTDEENEWYESIVDSYNESQDDVHVSLTVVPGDAWEQRMTAAQAAGNAPDVRTMNYGDIRDAARTSQIVPLTDLISEDAWGDVQENVLESVSSDGERYAYPMLVEPSAVLYYRTDLFEDAGLDGPPTSWDELIDYANQLTDDQVFGMRLAQTSVDMSWSTWGYQWNVAGHLPISEDWSEPAANEDFAPLLQAYQDLFDSGALPPGDGIGYADATPYGEGEFAMMANGSWAASQLLADYPEIAEVTEVAAMPSFSGEPGETTATLGGWTWVVDGNSEVTEEAAGFIEWSLGGDTANVVPFFEATVFSKVSPRQSVADAIAELPDVDSVNPWNATIQEDIVPFAQQEPAYPWNVSLAMGEAIEAAMQGTPVDEALATANDKIATEIANSELAGTGS